MSGRRSKRLRAEKPAAPRLPHGVQRSVEKPIAGKRLYIAGSDVRQTTHDLCILCGKHAQLELGHIVPRWAGKWLKDEGYVLGKYDSIGVRTRSQDIEKHYMMCRTCENFLGVGEGYLASIVRGAPSDLAGRRISLHREGDDLVRLDNVDAGLVMRAVMGVVFKAHMSPHHVFTRVRLPGWALSELLEALRDDTYPRDRFAIFAIKVMNLTVPGANPRARIDAELRDFAPGVGAVLRFGGFVFVAHIGAVNRFPLESDVKTMREGDKSMWIGVGEFSYEPGILPADAFELPRVPTSYVGTASSCPCGSGLAFAQCCQGRWLPPRARFLRVPNKATQFLR